MIAKVLWITGSAICLWLGTLHLLFTFFTDKFFPRKADVQDVMQQAHTKFTSRVDMWNLWIGFNGSHSIGAMFLGLINIVLAVSYYDILSTSFAIIALTLATSFFYLFLAIKYWFSKPLIGIALATACFVVSAILQLL